MARIEEELHAKIQNNKHKFIANLIFTSNWFRNSVVEYLKPDNISFQQFNILRILHGAKGWKTMNDIKKLMVEKSPNATRLADKLIDKGLVKRKRSDVDRRIVYLAITPSGAELLENIDEREGSYMDCIDKITDDEALIVSEILDRIRG